MSDPNTPRWHSMTTDAVREALESSDAGLSDVEAKARLARFGPNHLPRQKHRPALLRFFDQFRNVLIYILLTSALAAGLLGHLVDAIVIGGVVLLNALIGYVQEGKAEQAMAAIGKLLARTALVQRDGRWQTVPTDALVPGDRVRIEAGDRVPADLRLEEVNDLEVDQAALTGESLPVSKSNEPVAADTDLADFNSMAFSGSIVTQGTATARVVSTGGGTELGKISHLLSEVESLTTPLLRKINRFGRALTLLSLGLAILMMAIAIVVHDEALGEAVLAAIALIVAAIRKACPRSSPLPWPSGCARWENVRPSFGACLRSKPWAR